MAARDRAGPDPRERIRIELRALKESVAGVSGSVVATSDGFLVWHDARGLEPTEVAALAATARALASRAILATGRGQFREVVTRGSDGYLAVYAAGEHAILAVVGTSELNLAMLHYRARDAAGRIGGYSSAGARPASAPGGRATAARDAMSGQAATTPGRLPVRRPG